VREQVETIGRYTVLHRLEVGESGAVYLADDPILMRRVAIKVVSEGLVEKGWALACFHHAAEVAVALKHPNVVGVFEAGEDRVVGPFLVMEFVDGSSLADLAEGGSLELEARLRWLLQIMRALEVAHDLGIVHGDINLGKVLVSRERIAKLMGFTPAAVHDGAGASAAADRYAFSVMALELMNEEWRQSARSSSADFGKVGAQPLGALAGMRPSLVGVFERALAEDPAEWFVDLESFMRELIDASPLDVSVCSQLQAALNVRQLVAEESSAHRGDRSEGTHERTAVAPYQRALALAMVGMAAVAAIAVGLTRLNREVPEPVSARTLNVVSAPQGTIPVDAKRLRETPRGVFVDPEARRLRLGKVEAKRAVRARVATRKPPKRQQPLPAALASPAKAREPGGLLVVVGRGLDNALRGWLPEGSRE
jgi:hypothetical protein